MLCFVGKLDLSRINCRPSWSDECSHGLPRAALLLQLHGKSGSLSKSPSQGPTDLMQRACVHQRETGRIAAGTGGEFSSGSPKRGLITIIKKKIRKENKSPIR